MNQLRFLQGEEIRIEGDVHNSSYHGPAGQNSARDNVQIFADLEGSNPQVALRTASPYDTRNSPHVMLSSNISGSTANIHRVVMDQDPPSQQNSQKLASSNVRPSTPRSSDEQFQTAQSQTTGYMSIKTQPQQQAAPPKQMRKNTPREEDDDRQIQQTTANQMQGMANAQTQAQAQGSTMVANQNLNQGVSPRGAALAHNGRESQVPTAANSGANTGATNSVSPQRQPSLRRKVTITVKPTTDDPNVKLGWSEEYTKKLQKQDTSKSTTNDQQPLKRKMTQKEVNIEKKQTLKRKLTVTVKNDPEKENVKVGWEKPTGGVEAVADMTGDKGTSTGLAALCELTDRPGIVAAIGFGVCLVAAGGAYLLYKMRR